jgi:hypothetical protein
MLASSYCAVCGCTTAASARTRGRWRSAVRGIVAINSMRPSQRSLQPEPVPEDLDTAQQQDQHVLGLCLPRMHTRILHALGHVQDPLVSKAYPLLCQLPDLGHTLSFDLVQGSSPQRRI